MGIRSELKEQIAEIFKDWGSELKPVHCAALRGEATKYSLADWQALNLAKVGASGGAGGILGGPVGLMAIIPDLIFCREVSTRACLGIGYILECEVDVENDMNNILAYWSEAASLQDAGTVVPLGKMGIKLSNKLAVKCVPKAIGKLVEKGAFKIGGKAAAKFAAKIATKASAKVVSKLVAKVGFGWIPIAGGLLSGGINIWLVGGLMEKAVYYYRHKDRKFLIIDDDVF